MKEKPNWVHIIGICGVVTSGLAVMFKYEGSKVTCTDKGLFPPISKFLEKYDIPIGIGYKANRLTDEDGKHPELVIIQGLKSDKNIEYQEAKRLGLTIKTFPEILAEYVIANESIVVAGTYGKTTISAVLVDIMKNANIDISYMYGGLNVNMDQTIMAKKDNTKFSIVEGDEYMTSLEDTSSKFFHYKTKYLILHSCQWEHPDMFPTEQSYVENFRNYVRKIPNDGFIVANANDKNVVDVVKDSSCRVIYYSANKLNAFALPDWYLEKSSKPLPTFIRFKDDPSNLEIIPYERKIIGEFNEENFLAGSVMAYELGVKKEYIQDTISEFKGIKRRLEIKIQSDQFLIIDDFGSSPPKANGSLQALRSDYPDSKIIAIFEPNTGNRTEASIPTYKDAFKLADEIIFPRFTKLPSIDKKRFNAEELIEYLKPFYDNITYVGDDDVLVNLLVKEIELGEAVHKVIVFMGSHGFRGMIEKLNTYFSI
ncbi:MAG TPA: Mur ligase family protein [Candidatus Dojkabacteria bacterium]|nr:Mur ligase family protein [Candidatus Dojkabacteria bacterium]